MGDVNFRNINGRDYIKSFANETYISSVPDGEISIDFYEEYIDSLAMMTMIDQGNSENVVNVIREKKVSITLNKSTAIILAKRLLEACEEDTENEGEDY